MSASITRRPDDRTTQRRQVTWRALLTWSLALLAGVAAAGAGIVVAEQLIRPAVGGPAVQPQPKAEHTDTAGTTANGDSAGAVPHAGAQAGPGYIWRRAYVGGKLVLIRIRSDAANVREDREIGK